MTPAERRAAWLDDMQDMINALRKDDSLPLPHEGTGAPITFYFLGRSGTEKDEMISARRALPWQVWDRKVREDDDPSTSVLKLIPRTRALKVQLTAYRDSVCRVVGHEDREVEITVTPAVKETVTRSMPVWKCEPLLAGDDAAVTA